MSAARRFVGPLLAALAAIALSGCPDPRTPAPPDALATPGAVLTLVAERAESIRSLSAEARVSYYSDQGARKGKMVILARRPASLHFSALSPTDDLVAFLASDGERFTSFERGADVCHVGRSCPENVGRLLPIVMEGREVVSVLTGGAPVIRNFHQDMEWDARAGAYRLELEGEDGWIQHLWVEHGTGAVKRTVLRKGGEKRMELAFEDFAEVDGHVLPRTLRFRMKRGDVDLKLVYRDVDLNRDLEDDAFSIPCPDGTRVEELRCWDEAPGAAPVKTPTESD
ncbi:MAG: DUF4292 domain-containing protein [Myxococcota bacterium]